MSYDVPKVGDKVRVPGGHERTRKRVYEVVSVNPRTHQVMLRDTTGFRATLDSWHASLCIPVETPEPTDPPPMAEKE